MPKLWNKSRDKDIPSHAVYIGRPSKWGNPYTHLKSKSLAEFNVATRDQAVDMYDSHIARSSVQMVEMIRRELAGKDLVCWCSPERCHGEVLMRIANEN